MSRILIVTAGPLCRNPRVLKEATSLDQAGFEVSVVTLANLERFENYDHEIMRDVGFTKTTLDRVSKQPFSRIVDLTERAVSRAARSAIRIGIESPLSFGPYLALKRMVLDTPADLTILHTEIPFCMGPSLIANGRKISADFEDWHSRDLLPSSRASRPLRLLDRIERFLMRSASFTSTPSDAMAKALQAVYGGLLPVTIPNTFPLQRVPRPSPRQSPPAFFWFSQTIGEGRGLEAFLDAWNLSKSPSSVSLLGEVSDSYREGLLRRVSVARRKLLKFLPLTSPGNLPAVIAEHDIGLALEPKSPESRFLTTTNKIFQYLNAGLAIIATPTAGQIEVLSKAPEAGLLDDLTSPPSLAIKLDDLFASPYSLAAMSDASRKAAEQFFSWECHSPRLVNAVVKALQK